MRNTLKVVIEAVNTGKLADAKVMFAELASGFSTYATFEAAMSSRTKVNFLSAIDILLAQVEAEQSPQSEGIQTRLEEITATLHNVIEQQANNYFLLARLLAEAKEEFETTLEFLQWADAELGFKKAYVYRILQVAKAFSEEVWHSVPVITLYTLHKQGTEADIENARLFIEKGGVLSKENLSVLLDGQAQNKPKAPKAPTAQETVSELEKANRELSDALVDGAQRDVTIKLPQGLYTATPVVETPAPAQPDPQHMQQITELMTQIAELTTKLAEATKPKIRDLKSIPMLRQFHSSDYKLVLGLTAEEANDKGTILEAFKDFVRAGYGRGHEAFPLLDKARHELIHSIKAAA